MNSGRQEVDAAHRRATEEASRMRCLSCGAPAPSLPAHWPRHRGSGGRWANPWHPSLWIPLCFTCHEALDARNGVSAAARKLTEQVRSKVAAEAPLFCRRIPMEPPEGEWVHPNDHNRAERGLLVAPTAPFVATPAPAPADFEEA